MACLLGQDVSPEELQLADHVYMWGSPLHTQHGVVVELSEAKRPWTGLISDDLHDDIHVLCLSRSVEAAKARRVTLREFIAEGQANWCGSLRRARYGVPWAERRLRLPGASYPMEACAVAEALRRARALLEISEERPDDLGPLTAANSEHMAVWCKTGQWRSSQVDCAWGLASAAAIAAGAAAACRSPGAAVLPLLGATMLWRASQEEGLLYEDAGAPAALLDAGCCPEAPEAAEAQGLDHETDYVVVYEGDAAQYAAQYVSAEA